MNVLRQLVKVIVDRDDEKEIVEYRVEQLRFKRKTRKEKINLDAESIKELEKLEKEEKQDGSKSKLS